MKIHLTVSVSVIIGHSYSFFLSLLFVESQNQLFTKYKYLWCLLLVIDICIFVPPLCLGGIVVVHLERGREAGLASMDQI